MAMPKTQITGIYEEAEGETRIEIWLERVRKELKEKQGGSVLYRGRKRHICRIQETNIETGEEMIKKGGAYLITGGFGGLGILFAEHLAKTKGANIILTGRSGMDEDKERKIKGLEKAGGNVMYREADVCDVGRMKEVFGEGKRRFGRIDGIIHAAGISAGGSIFNKGIKDFENVLSPKVKGTIALDEMLKGEGIDFICYFASSSGILGDFGSCDYAVGNRFQMSYGGYMNRPGDEGKRVVINWPLWREGGMGFNDLDSAGMYLKSSGQRLLEKEEGIEIFERLLSQKKTQHLVIAGQRSRVERYLRGIEGREIEADDKVISGYTGIGRRAGMKGLSVEECIEWDIKEQIRGMLKIKSEKLGREENLAEFGFDSISLGQFAKNLSVYYGIEITPAVFYGYSTIGKLTGYLHKEYAEKMKTFYAEESAPRNDMRKIAVNWESRPMIKRESRPELRDDYKGNMEKIAIIGMSGRFPESGNVEEMWKILAEGREVIKDYPVERMKGKMRADSGWRCGCVPGVDEFDPLFFEISPREAEVMDPRQRLLLEESWKALEDAGYGPEQIKKGKIGMFVGVEQGGYQYLTREKASITSNHDGILAARLAYFLGFDGPVMAINTACSSGLVAAHQACMSLRNGECETAIAAGVNLILMPEMFGVMKQAGMLSPEGKCYAFDKRANGLAAGEAVAVVVLKRLCLAQEEGDPIYGIIRGSGINYDGKTNGITAPNGVAQSELYKTVYDKSGVNPEEIEYIVTHGTGTILGDPVEVNALNDVFKAYTKKEGYCALTSTKTNFGHSFAASGLLSLISLIEAFRHEMIPASLNCAEENEYIQWKGSPFYINKKNKEWKSKEGKSRMGAVSAFGMSGTNAHMVVESCTEEEGKEGELPYVLIALSARSPESLQERIGDMIHVLESKEWGGNELSRMSYTLIEGREHFDHRLAVVVKDREDAIEALKRAGRNETIPNLFRGKVSHEFKEQKAIEQYTKELVGQARISVREEETCQEKLNALAELYIQGYKIPWAGMYEGKEPRRMRLPAYPFAKKRYWIDSAEEKKEERGEMLRYVHPLLHENTSDFKEQRFSTVLTGREFFLAGHQVEGRKVLPGAAYLEMARAAVEAAAGKAEGRNTEIRLKNVVWAGRVTVEEKPLKINIGLIPGEGGEILYEVYSESKEGEYIVYNQGTAEIGDFNKRKNVDLKTLQNRKWEQYHSPADYYRILKELGMENNPDHQWIEAVYAGDDEALVKLSMPVTAREGVGEYQLHPSVMNSALQAAVVLLLGKRDEKKPGSYISSLPVTLEELEIHSPCRPNMWGLIRYHKNSILNEIPGKIDMDLYDEAGDICIRMKGLGYRSNTISNTMPVSVKNEEKIYTEKVKDTIPEETLLEYLTGSLADTLYMDRSDIDPDKKFIEMGMDSIIAVEWIKTINKKYGTQISATKVYDYPSVRELAGFLMNELNHRIEKVSRVFEKLHSTSSEVIKPLMELSSGMYKGLLSPAQSLEKPDYFSLKLPVEQVFTIKTSLHTAPVNLSDIELSQFSQQRSKDNNASSIQFQDIIIGESLIDYLSESLAETLYLQKNDIDPDKNFIEMGMDSILGVEWIKTINKKFGTFIIATKIYDYPNIRQFDEYLRNELNKYKKETGGISHNQNLQITLHREPSLELVSGLQSQKKISNLFENRFLRNKSNSSAIISKKKDLIAIIGISGRYPDAENMVQYWNNLVLGRNSIKEIPISRWDIKQYYDPHQAVNGKIYCKWLGMLDDIETFDPLFFNISPAEAETMDPQHRLFLQEGYKAFEDAGYSPQLLSNRKCGVYLGIMSNEYGIKLIQNRIGLEKTTSNSYSIGAARIPYFLNLKGPAIPIDTACSSSLVAAHLGCQALLNHEIDMALIGGVTLYLVPESYIGMCSAGMLSPEGQCKTFDNGANGFVPGEGAGAIVLKRLTEAENDRDHIYGVILGSGINQDGKTNGITAPSVNSQMELEREIYNKYHIEPESIGYVEMHGTGTKLGDPIELEALSTVYRERTNRKKYCAIGSVKSNIGHTSAASGIASIQKVLLCMNMKSLYRR